MKIFYLSTAILPSKTANSLQIMNMCNAFFENGNDVTLIAPYRKNNKKIDGVNIYDFYGVKKNIKIHFLYYPNVVGGAFIYSLILLLYLIKFRPDLVYGRFLLGCALSTFLGLKVMYESHNESWKETFYSIDLLKYLNRKKNFSKIIVISNAIKKAFHAKLLEQRLLIRNKKITTW